MLHQLKQHQIATNLNAIPLLLLCVLITSLTVLSPMLAEISEFQTHSCHRIYRTSDIGSCNIGNWNWKIFRGTYSVWSKEFKLKVLAAY